MLNKGENAHEIGKYYEIAFDYFLILISFKFLKNT